MYIVLEICVILLIYKLPVSKGFSYETPDNWGIEYPTCDGKFQSPINIDNNGNEEAINDKSLEWNGYDDVPDAMKLMNTGHTIQLTPHWIDELKKPYLSIGPLNGEYVLEQIHFHWGTKNDFGSEHTINNKSYAFEIHLVHWKRDYGSFSNAAGESDGLAVVASLHEVRDDKDSDALAEIIGFVVDLESKGMETDIPAFPISHFAVVGTTNMIASYQGSLTTPGCNEAVTWIVVMHEYPILEHEILKFRNIQLDSGDNHNNRPIQPLNDREITFYH